MSNDESDLEQLLDDGMERTRAALDASENGELPDEKAESVRESADAVADGVTDASLGELLTAAGFESESDDVTPANLPILMQDADTDTVLDLRHLLELADLSDEWSNLDEGERLDRLERIGGEETTDDSGRSVSDLLSSVFSIGESDEGTTDEGEHEEDGTESEEQEGEDEATDGEEGEEDDSSATEQFRSLFDTIKGGEDETDEADGEETEDESNEGSGDESGGKSRRRATSRYSTMPSSRSDMGSSKRHSTVRGKD